MASFGLDRKKKLLHKKARIQRLSAGDQNTTFYHHVVQEHTARNKINVLYNDAGEALLDPEDIKIEAVNYFRNFLQADSRRSAPAQKDVFTAPKQMQHLGSPLSLSWK